MDLSSFRPDLRKPDQMRPVSFIPDFAPNATGSVLVSFGSTRVICAATLERKVPTWMMQQKVGGGWITAEYSLLPYSTGERKARDITRGKLDGRTVEIQRLIGRAIRAVTDLKKLPGMTLWIDCDVVQADGGTRTASITGAYVAACMAVNRLMKSGDIKENPFVDSVAAVSVGVWNGLEVLDLNYAEDKDAEVDANVVMTGMGRFVETQVAGEEATFERAQLDRLLILAESGIRSIADAQSAVIKVHKASL